MDLLILTTATDRSLAAITSATDVTALEGPDAFPQLVLGTNEPLTVKHLSAASTYEAWSADAAYTVTASLGVITAQGLLAYTTATLSTVISNGKSGTLNLTTSELVSAASCGMHAWPPRQSLVLTLQITVTDGSGNKRVYAQLPVRLNGSVPAFTET